MDAGKCECGLRQRGVAETGSGLYRMRRSVRSVRSVRRQSCVFSLYSVSDNFVMCTLFVMFLLASFCPVTLAINNRLTYSVEEEEPVGAFVGNVAEDSGIRDDYVGSPELLTNLGYKFLSDPSNNFVIDNKTGIIRTRAVIDRETDCSGAELCTVKLDVAIILPADISIVKITVNIQDINDNAPQFPMPSITHEILESANTGIGFVIPPAVDTDGPSLGVQHYELISSSSKFELQIRDKVGGSKEVRLVLAEKLDREREDMYEVQVLAFDGGSSARSGSVDITIKVLDANDNNPVFKNSTYEVSIPENHPVQAAILRVEATDPDIGLNGKVQYSFSDQTQADFGQLFGIRSNSGVIYVKGVIDYEEASIYHLGVVAQDEGPDSLPADATVIVRVLDLNDHAPEITVNTLTAAGTTEAGIAENSAIGTFVAHITVEDKDAGKNGQFNCTLNDQQFELQHMFEAYKILTAGPLDREKRSQYNLALQCKDGGNNPQVSVTHLKVVVTDENDHTPVFDEPSYAASILESNYVGAPIVTVNATDGDIDKNANIRYQLPDIASRLFHINPITGKITAAISFDREIQETYQFEVIAKDQGTPARSSMAQVIVTILDINDRAPEFNQTVYEFAIGENTMGERVIGTVQAHDDDKYPYNVFSYSLFASASIKEMFSVDAATGEFRTHVALDRDVESYYSVVVLAKDRGNPPQVGSATVMVLIGDDNDNEPTFVFPREGNNTVQVSTRAESGDIVTRLHSHDMDSGNNAKVTYYIDGGNEAGFFELDRNLGILSLKRDLSEASVESFELALTITDHGSPPRSDHQVLNIVVNATVPHAGESAMSGHNFIIVITLACASGIVTIVLVTAIVIIRRQDMDKKAHKYNCRMEALKILANSKDASRDSEDSGTSRGLGGDSHHIKRKEVSFCVEIEDEKIENKNRSCQSWPSSIDHHVLQHPQACSSLLTNKTMSPPNGCIPRVPQYGPPHINNNQPRPPGWPHNARDAEVHQLLELLKQDHSETQSNLSNEGSNTDSGRGSGASDEGEHTVSHGRHNNDSRSHLPSIADVSEDSHQYTAMSDDSFRGNQVVPNLPNQSFGSNLSTFSQAPSTIKSQPLGQGSLNYRKAQEQQLNDSLFSHNNSQSADNTLVELHPTPIKGLDLGFVQTPCSPPQHCQSNPSKDSPQKPRPSNRDNHNKDSKAVNRTVDSELDGTGIIQYSCADMSDILKTRTDSVMDSVMDNTDKDDISMCTTTSGSYVVDPQDLCDEIDELFFKDMVV